MVLLGARRYAEIRDEVIASLKSQWLFCNASTIDMFKVRSLFASCHFSLERFCRAPSDTRAPQHILTRLLLGASQVAAFHQQAPPSEMTLKRTRFTPETLLSLPRRDAGAPNHDASKILYSVSSYSFEKHKQSAELRLLDAKTNESKLITDDKEASSPVWLDDGAEGEGLAVVLRSAAKGSTQVLIGNPDKWRETYAPPPPMLIGQMLTPC